MRLLSTENAHRKQSERSTQPVGPTRGDGELPMVGPEEAPHKVGRPISTEHTTSFEAPQNVKAARLLKARVKVNSTRQGTPRPTGPWTPGALQRAVELKSNESGEIAPNVPVWPRPSCETVEYQAFAALSKPTVPVEPAFVARSRIKPWKGTRPLPSNNMTVPVSAAPDLLLHRVHHTPAPRLAADVLPGRESAHALSAVIEAPSHGWEKAVSFVLFAAMLGLVYLNLS